MLMLACMSLVRLWDVLFCCEHLNNYLLEEPICNIPANSTVPKLKRSSADFRMLLQASQQLIKDASVDFGSKLERKSLKRLYSNFHHIFRFY